jgi:uncharacterized protein (DUF427 family)
LLLGKRQTQEAQMDKPVKIPGPDHPITLMPNLHHVSVTAGGRIIAETDRALYLKEASYPAVIYIPREDVDMTLLDATDHTTYCPYKGDCSYFSIAAGGDKAINAIWSYEHPYDSVRQIAGHLAFYPDRIDSLIEA